LIREHYPELKITFEPMELVEKIMSQGATTPVSIKVAAKSLSEANQYALKIKKELEQVPSFRDVHIAESIDYPTLSVEVDRELAAQFGLDMKEISQTLTTATSSSRYTHKNLWVDPKSGLTFQVQVQLPEHRIQYITDLTSLPHTSYAARPTRQLLAS